MKKAIMAALLSVCVMLTSACTININAGGDSSSQSSDSSQSQQADTEAQADITEAPAEQTEAPIQQTEAPIEQTEAPAQQGTQYDWSQIPDMPTNSYLTLDGSNIAEGMFYYTTDETGNPLLMSVFNFNGGTYTIGVVIPSTAAVEGAAFNNKAAFDAGCQIVFADAITGEYVESAGNSAFQNGETHIGLYRYTSGQLATFYVKTEIPMDDGTHILEMAGESGFVERSQLEGAGNTDGNTGGNGGGTTGSRCMVCYGTGVCSFCDGDGLCSSCRGEGMIGNSICYTCGGAKYCKNCGGNGLCQYCNGTGIV